MSSFVTETDFSYSILSATSFSSRGDIEKRVMQKNAIR